MVLEVLTTLEVLHKGLLTVGYDQAQLDRVGMRKNVSRFRTNYVSHPRIYADLFQRLQTSPAAALDCSILGLDKTVNYFFVGIYLLAQYPTEEKSESAFSFKMCDRTFRDHAWDMVEKIAAMHPEIIAWPERWSNPDDPNGPETRFIMSVDGTHCRIEEPRCDRDSTDRAKSQPVTVCPLRASTHVTRFRTFQN